MPWVQVSALCWPWSCSAACVSAWKPAIPPAPFKGLPITLIYIGVLALAIYGFTGHSVIL